MGTMNSKTAAGRTLRTRVAGIPAAQLIEGPWDVDFLLHNTSSRSLEFNQLTASSYRQVSFHANLKFDRLSSWSDSSEAAVKYFSGTAAYRKTFSLPADTLALGRAVYLDLGKIAVIAEVKLNGKDLGTLWNAPFRIEATSALRPGENLLEVRVTNLWVNRMIGDEQLPGDSARAPDGQLTAWPKWLLEGRPSPAGRQTFATRRVWEKTSPLQPSGLLGPVKLHTTQRVVPE